MTRKFWTIVVAALFIICLASMADAQSNGNHGENPGNGNQGENPGNGNQGQNPGNGNQGENPGNGNQGQNPGNGNGNQGQHLGNGNGNQGENPGNGNSNQAENPRNSRRRTPDGETPAEEGTCDELKHGTPGLYGLCIAFCEAHDCVPVLLDDDTLDLSHCKKNDRKLLDKYRDKMREGDPDMPCVPNNNPGGGGPSTGGEVTCLCWNEDDFDKFRNPLVFYPDDTSSLIETRQVQCEAYSDSEDGDCWEYVDYKSYYQGFSSADYTYRPYSYWFELAIGDGACEDVPSPYCSRLEWCVGTDCPQSYDGSFSILLTPEEYAACEAELAELDPYCY